MGREFIEGKRYWSHFTLDCLNGHTGKFSFTDASTVMNLVMTSVTEVSTTVSNQPYIYIPHTSLDV